MEEIKRKIQRTRSRVKTFVTNPVARKSYFQRHFGKKEEYEVEDDFTPIASMRLEHRPTFVDLTSNTYASTGKTPTNANSALFNDFMEEYNPNVHTVSKWKTLPADYKLRDARDMPLEDISNFQGVENGTYKIGPLSSFADSTTVVPVRTKRGPGIVEITGDPDYDTNHQKWEKDRLPYKEESDAAWKAYQSVKDSVDAINFKPIKDRVLDILVKNNADTNYVRTPEAARSSWHSAVHRILGDYSDAIDLVYSADSSNVEMNTQLRNLEKLRPLLDSIPDPNDNLGVNLLYNSYNNANHKLWEYDSKNPEPKAFSVKFANDSTSTEFPVFDKMTLGNTKGGFFLSDPTILKSKSVTNRINQFIKDSGEPLVPAIQDSGAFSYYIYNDEKVDDVVNRYLEQGYGVTPQNTFVVGTTLNKNGGVLFGKGGIPLIVKRNTRLNYPSYTDGTCTGVDACAAYSNQQIRNLGGDIWGNAWNLDGNIEKVADGYSGEVKPTKYSRSKIEAYNDRVSDNMKDQYGQLISDLDPNEVYAVNMYYRGSGSLPVAFEEGKDSGTHTGMLRFNNDLNDWEVVHNIHGQLHVDNLVDTLGSGKRYGVTSIYKVSTAEPNPIIDWSLLDKWKK